MVVPLPTLLAEVHEVERLEVLNLVAMAEEEDQVHIMELEEMVVLLLMEATQHQEHWEEVVEEEARRIALHIAPVAAVIDVELVVIGGGIGVNGDLLLAPIRARLGELLPYAPRVEVSSLGDAAVLTGALAIGLRTSLDNVFVNRIRSARRS